MLAQIGPACQETDQETKEPGTRNQEPGGGSFFPNPDVEEFVPCCWIDYLWELEHLSVLRTGTLYCSSLNTFLYRVWEEWLTLGTRVTLQGSRSERPIGRVAETRQSQPTAASARGHRQAAWEGARGMFVSGQAAGRQQAGSRLKPNPNPHLNLTSDNDPPVHENRPTSFIQPPRAMSPSLTILYLCFSFSLE